MVKLRVHGLPDEVDATVAWLRACFSVIDESDPFPNRPPSKEVRVYVTIKAEAPPDTKNHAGSI